MKVEKIMITVVTGAGVSASAGIPTYRDVNSTWTDKTFEERSHAKAYGNHLDYLKPKWLELWKVMSESEPTLFHKFVADQGWNVITQNIDGLHRRAGSKNVIEVHGSMDKWRRLKADSKNSFSADLLKVNEYNRIVAELEDKNGELVSVERVRPDIVLFGERLKNIETAVSWVTYSDVVIYTGTSGNVFPVADWYVNSIGKTVLVDPVSWGRFDEFYKMTADEWVNSFKGF